MNLRAVAIRPGRDSDAAGLIALIGRCWADYPGCILDVEREEQKLLALATYYGDRGGALWVAEDGDAVVGMAAVKPASDDVWEIAKLYAHPDCHGTGLAHRLLDMMEAHAWAQGAKRLTLWTDTRFIRAHRFYEKRSWVRAGPVRAIGDLSGSIEFDYVKPLDGILQLNASAAASAERRLAEILVACVEGGASVSFLAPLPLDLARSTMREVAQQVATGRCILLAAWAGGVLFGTVRVQLDTPLNQPHRAEICKMLVHPEARRHGLGQALMLAAETAAIGAGRTLLTLDTLTGDAGERLYRRLGWTEVGAIPGYSVDAAGRPESATIFYKRLSA